jgi:hypothetical protein
MSASVADARPRGLLWWALWALLGLAFAVQVVRMRLAESAVRDGNGQLAASVRPQNGAARALRAEAYLQVKDPKRAAAESLAALDRAPLSVPALRTLALAREAMSGPGAGESAWQTASMLGWRDKQTQLWALLRALSNGEAEILAMRADALLRTGDRDGKVTAMLRQFMIEPEVRAAFVKRLILKPTWRLSFFTTPPSRRGEGLEGLLATLRELSRTNAPPTRQETRAAGEGLLERRRLADFASLRTLFEPGAGATSRLLDDGGFERSDFFYRREVSQFDWNMITGNHASANLDESEGGHVAVSTSGGTAQVALYRYLPLPPGAYRLSYSTRGGSTSPAAIGIYLACAAGQQLAESSREPLTSSAWETRQLTFRTDASCPVVMLNAGGLGTEAAEAQFDNFNLQRVDGTAPAPRSR